MAGASSGRPRGVYVLVTHLRGEAVGSAYYNPTSSNVDFGVHVVRNMWRRGIGTRLLVEAAPVCATPGDVSNAAPNAAKRSPSLSSTTTLLSVASTIAGSPFSSLSTNSLAIRMIGSMRPASARYLSTMSSLLSGFAGRVAGTPIPHSRAFPVA